MGLLLLPLRSGATATVEAGTVDGWPSVIYFCSKASCPHFKGQPGLLPGADEMHCALVRYPPDRTCQAYYTEAVEELDRARRDTWEARLDDAEAFEAAVSQAARSQQGATA
jgi:hypothetical protein